MQVFVSHSGKDAGIYSSLCLALDAAGIRRWEEASEMTPSESLAVQLRQAIHDCRCCVFIVTRCSVASNWCLAELGAFWGAAKKVFLYMGESGLSDSDLPVQFRGSFWTSDASILIDNLKKEAEVPTVVANHRPANVFWLGHDLVRVSELLAVDPNNRDEIALFLLQGLHHLSEIGLTSDNDKVTTVLLRALASIMEDDTTQEHIRANIRDCVRQAKDEIGDRMKRFQPHFEVWASPDQKERWKEAARSHRNRNT